MFCERNMLSFTLATICTGFWFAEGSEPPAWPTSCSYKWKKNVSDVLGGENGMTEGTTYFSTKNKSYRFDKTGDDGIIFIFPEEGRVYWRTPALCTYVNVNKVGNARPIPNPLPSLAGYEKNGKFRGAVEKWEFHLELKGIRLNHTIFLRQVNLEGREMPVPIRAEYRTTAISDPTYPGRSDVREYFNYSPEDPDQSVWLLDKSNCKLTKEPAKIAEMLKIARFRNAPASVKNAEPENW